MARSAHIDAAAVEWWSDDQIGPVNSVRLLGRVSGNPESRELPSGDTVVMWRVVVSRDSDGRPGVDTIDCAAWEGRHRRAALRLPAGAVVAVEGRLRRRFWRGAGGPVSRYEVEVVGLKRRRDLEQAA